MLRAMWRVLETGSRKLLNGHENRNVGHSQGVSYGLPRQRPTLPGIAHKPNALWMDQIARNLIEAVDVFFTRKRYLTMPGSAVYRRVSQHPG